MKILVNTNNTSEFYKLDDIVAKHGQEKIDALLQENKAKEKLDKIEDVIVFDLKRDFSKYEKIEGYLQEMREEYDVSNEYKYAHDCGVLKAIVQRFYSTIKDIDNIIKTK